MVKTWNGAYTFILYGRSDKFASDRREHQDFLMFALHLSQHSLIYINTLMMQQVLAEPNWQGRLITAALQALCL